MRVPQGAKKGRIQVASVGIIIAPKGVPIFQLVSEINGRLPAKGAVVRRKSRRRRLLEVLKPKWEGTTERGSGGIETAMTGIFAIFTGSDRRL